MPKFPAPPEAPSAPVRPERDNKDVTASTVRMIHPERDNKEANVHPAEVENWKREGWRVAQLTVNKT